MHPNDIDVVNILIYQAIFFLLDTRQENRFPYNLVLTTPNIRPLVDWSVSPTSFFVFKIFIYWPLEMLSLADHQKS